MAASDVFKWLVEYHCRVNLERCLPYISEGKVHIHGEPLDEGFEENELCKGVLVVANGETLFSRLREDAVVHDDACGEHAAVKTKQDFFRYLLNQKNSDGAYVFDSVNGRITRVSEINNHLPGASRVVLAAMVPEDFVAQNGDISVQHNLGTKTRLAIKLPHAYENTETYQIKRSAYTDFGMGKVTHFNQQGLIEEFFFTCDPEVWITRPHNSIKMVYRRYGRNSEGNLLKIAEEIRSLGALKTLKSLKVLPALRAK